jgi:cell division protein FtsQ
VAWPGPRFGRRRRGERPDFGEVLIDDETRRRIRQRRIRRLLAVTGVVATAAGLVALYFSPFLRVQNVEVSGAVVSDPTAIAAMADAEGESMISGDFSAAEARIAELPLIKEVHIERRFPQTLRVVITERAPWGIWSSGGSDYVIDAEGVILPDVGAPGGAPVIHVLDGTATWAAGERVDSDAVQLTRALAEQVPGRLGQAITWVEWSSAKGLALATDAGYRVVIGDSENMEYKLAVWQQIEAELGRETMNGHVLDLRFGDRPAFQ